MSATNVLPMAHQLRVFRKLDVSGLSEEFIKKVGEKEGNYEYVDADFPRDIEYTEEIIANTIGAALVDPDGEILREWEGADAFVKAQLARSTARVTFDVEIEDEPESE